MHQTLENLMIKYPASAIQHQFWLINQLQPESPAYHIPSFFRIKGNFNYHVFVQSINEIISRHSIFRTSFVIEHEKLLQSIRPELHILPKYMDLSDIPDELKENRAQTVIEKEIVDPFDLTQAPLLRLTVIKLQKDEHILLILMHHIITDLKSKAVFSEELSRVYDALSANQASPLKTAPRQYHEYAVWHQNWKTGDQYKKMCGFWQNKLVRKERYLNLPTDHNRPAIQQLSGSAHPIAFSKLFVQNLKTFSRKQNVNIYLTLLASYITLLYRYSGQKEFIIGVPLTNRRNARFKDTIGCFVNILPLSVQLSGALSFKDVLQTVRKEMLDLHRNQEVPYEEIVRELRLKRDMSYNPLFQAGFTFEPPMTLNLNGVSVTTEKIHNKGAQLDIFATFWETSGAVDGFIEYNSDLFESPTILRFIEHYKILLLGIIGDATRSISSFPILTDFERQQYLGQRDGTHKTLPENPVIHHQIEIQAAATPEATAVGFGNHLLCYRELNERANQVAHYLLSLGVGPETLVGVFLERSIEMLISIIGVLKAGGAYVPMDPDFPKERLGFMLEDSGLSIILTQKSLEKELPESDCITINLDTDWHRIATASILNPNVTLSPDSLAYVIFTSGSTGRPKGVQVPHIAAVNFLLSMRETIGIEDKDVLLAVTTLSFDISVLELFLPLIAGAQTVICDHDTAGSGDKLYQLLTDTKATIMQATPTTWYLLTGAGWQGEMNFKILCGGEPLPHGLAVKLLQCSKNVWNLYGPTETTVWSTCYKLSSEQDPILVGKPIANTQIYIVNEENQLNPPGISGELLIGGMGVTRGYLNRPDLTEQSFIPDMVTKDPERFLYRTGDMACMRPDGNIKLYGRMDHQIKLRGFRIELGEIESHFSKHAAIDKLVVMVREDDINDKRLVAYFTHKAGHNASTNDFRDFLRTTLPDYMIPSIFVKLAAMPLTPNGKIDRRALPQPLQNRSDLGDKFVPPQNATEALLSDIWGELLKIDHVGTHDNFFDLGGDSLLSLRLVDLIQERMDFNISVVNFFQFPTIRTLSEYIDHNKPTKNKISWIQNRVKHQRQALTNQKRVLRNANTQ